MDRFIWIDWMKAIGMYLIILGHVFTWGAEFVYTFSVPLFFCMSGFLSKRDSDFCQQIRKMFYNLFVPMVLISTINFIVIKIIKFGGMGVPDLFEFLTGIVTGRWTVLGTMWFVYTLLIIKFCYISLSNWKWKIVGGAIFAIISITHRSGSPNAFDVVGLAYPFFMMGAFLRRFKDWLNAIGRSPAFAPIMLICMLIVHYCGRHNGYVFLFDCVYGKSIVLFLIGGMAGIIWTFLLCKLLHFKSWIVTTIAVGSILILGFHNHLVDFGKSLYTDSYVLDYALALAILILFVPIILLCERYFPLILGWYRKR